MRAFAVLSSNYAGRAGLLAENGLSLYIRFNDTDLIFDTGAGSLFSDNADFMNLPLYKASFVVISHIHSDHCGGLPFLSRNFSMVSMSCSVYHPEEVNLAGLPALKSVSVSSGSEIEKDIRTIVTESESDSGTIHEISLVVGNTLFTGCAHAGLSEIIRMARDENPVIDTVAGGIHNHGESALEMANTAATVADSGIKRIILLHCSSMKSVRYFEDCGIEVKIGQVGNSFVI